MPNEEERDLARGDGLPKPEQQSELPRLSPVLSEEPLIAVIDGRCGCNNCRARTENIYRMVGSCYNCGAKWFLLLYRAGDKAAVQDCPVCGNGHTVHPKRLATADEIPEAIAKQSERP